MQKFFINNWQLLGILLVYLFVALYKLDTIPGEIWGDAIFHYNLVEKIRHGNFFYDYEFGGDGPIFTYLATAVSFVIPLSFYSLKITAVIIGFFFVLSMYFLAKAFFREKAVALTTMFVSAVSFWTIDFVRQPHARILVPLFIAMTLIYTLKKKNVFAGILLGLGMYTQASFWGMTFTYWRNWKTLLIGAIVTIPLAYAFFHNPVSFFSKQSYFGEKLAVHTPLSQAFYAIGYNIQANLLSFNVKGDSIFRMNIPYHPHLDILSGILFILGFLLIFFQSLPDSFKSKIDKFFGFIRAPFKKNKIMRVETEKNFSYRSDKHIFLLYFILPFFFIQVPSFLDIHNYFSQPNISRMIGVIPFVYLSVAYCIVRLNRALTQKVTNKSVRIYVPFFIYCVLFLAIFLLNFYNYFIVYPRTLPNGNTPYGKLIANTIDNTTPQTDAVIIGAGWGQFAQPEVAGIPMVQKTIHPEQFFQTAEQAKQILCQEKQPGKPFLIASDPAFQIQLQATSLCLKQAKSYMLTSNGLNVAYIIEGIQ